MSSKRIHVTPKIQAAIRAGVGDPELNTDNLPVFESRSLTSEPITKRGTLFHGGRFTPATLQEMADSINKPGGAIPLQVMHDTGVLPVGKIFQGKTNQMENGETEVRTLFFISPSETKLIADVENSVIDEVSVQVLPNHIFCSECNFDFLGADSDFSNIYTLTCNEEHTIGENGVFARLVGLNSWKETSLVNTGAAKNPKILARAKQSLGKEAETLAASGKPLEAILFQSNYKLEASASDDNNQGDLKMEKELLAQFTAATTEVATLKAGQTIKDGEITTLKAANATIEASLKTATDEIAALKAAAGTDKTEVDAKLATAEKEIKDAAEMLRPHVEAALVASGASATDLPKDATFGTLLKTLEEKGLKVHQAISASASDKDDAKESALAASAAQSRKQEAFKTPKR